MKTLWEVSDANVTLVIERRKIMIRELNAKVRQNLPIVWCPTILIVKQLQGGHGTGKTGKTGNLVLTLPDRENTGNFVLTQGKIC